MYFLKHHLAGIFYIHAFNYIVPEKSSYSLPVSDWNNISASPLPSTVSQYGEYFTGFGPSK